MSVFEIVMLICFGSAWPFSIYKSWTARTNQGKSPWFLVIVLLGYISGIIHKILHNYDAVVFLYGLNGAMVLVDMMIYMRNRRLFMLSRAIWEGTEDGQ
jgi:hypothetical protein